MPSNTSRRYQLTTLPRQAPVSAEGLRIALFSGNYNCVRDGANRALNRLVAHLLDRGAEVRVYSPTARQPAFDPAGDLVSTPSIGFPGRPEYRLSTGFPVLIREDLQRFAPTHVHLSCPDFLGGRAQAFARSHHIPVVASLHTRFETYPAYYGLGFITPLIARRLKTFYSRSHLVLAPNRAMADSLRNFGIAQDRIRLWGRGVDHHLFTPARRSDRFRQSQGFGRDDVAMLFFGRLVHEKGLDTFVQAARILQDRGYRLKPLIVGEGPAHAWLQRQLPEAIFTGHLDGAALGQAVASADILVNPSVTEAFGNVNLEAMAAGLAIVSADVGSASALIEKGRTGLLVPARRAEAYADAIELLIRSPMRRRGIGLAASSASQSYNWNEILDSVIGAYRQAG